MSLKVVIWNINGVVRCLSLLLDWLARVWSYVVALQETKATDVEFPKVVLDAVGYGSVTVGQRLWNGVVLLVCGAEPIAVCRALSGDLGDIQARYVEVAIGGMFFVSIYLSNGNLQSGPKFVYKLAWFERLIVYVVSLQVSGYLVVLVGDFNVVPTDRDIYFTTSYCDNALLQLVSREVYVRLLQQGWTDVLCVCYFEETIYTFWDYLCNRWLRNVGLCIDYLLLSGSLVGRFREVEVDREECGREGVSDYVLVWVRLAAKRATRCAA